jgi:hypothetical protein
MSSRCSRIATAPDRWGSVELARSELRGRQFETMRKRFGRTGQSRRGERSRRLRSPPEGLLAIRLRVVLGALAPSIRIQPRRISPSIPVVRPPEAGRKPIVPQTAAPCNARTGDLRCAHRQEGVGRYAASRFAQDPAHPWRFGSQPMSRKMSASVRRRFIPPELPSRGAAIQREEVREVQCDRPVRPSVDVRPEPELELNQRPELVRIVCSATLVVGD